MYFLLSCLGGGPSSSELNPEDEGIVNVLFSSQHIRGNTMFVVVDDKSIFKSIGIKLPQ